MCHTLVCMQLSLHMCMVVEKWGQHFSQSATLCRLVDPHGQRTLGVVTKSDLATWGLRARLEATGENHLRMELGYVAVWFIVFMAVTCLRIYACTKRPGQDDTPVSYGLSLFAFPVTVCRVVAHSDHQHQTCMWQPLRCTAEHELVCLCQLCM